MNDCQIISLHKTIFAKEHKYKIVNDYFSNETEKKLIQYSRNIWNNILIDTNENSYIREYDKLDISFNIYTLFVNQNHLNCEPYGSYNYINYLFDKLYEAKDNINNRWRIVCPSYHLPYFDLLFPIFQKQQDITSNKYIVKAWIPRMLTDVTTIEEDPNCSLNRSLYYNTYSIYIIINNIYYLWVSESWYCHEDAPDNTYYSIKPSLITDNIHHINKYLHERSLNVS